VGVLELGPLGLSSHPDWREGLPIMVTSRVMLRELRRGDAPELMRLATAPEIAPHTWPAPDNVEAFERFIEWTRSRRAAGKYTCFAVVPTRHQAPAGLFELRSLQPGFFRAELSFFIEQAFWGTGVFHDAARLVCDFAFKAVGVHRIEARAEVDNDRANGALRKLGATNEGRLVAAFVRNGQPVDQYLWSLVNGVDVIPPAPKPRA
jgi:[ribosomal protein S5]-alanine N-acetyltransferase